MEGGAVSKPVFAVDVGGVLASKQHDGQPLAGCLRYLPLLADKYDLKIVSQCGKNRALLTRQWLGEHDLAKYFSDQIYLGFEFPNKNVHLKKIGARTFLDDRKKHIFPALRLGIKCFHLGSSEPELVAQGSLYTYVPDWEYLSYLV